MHDQEGQEGDRLILDSHISDLPKPNDIKHCERSLWEKLRNLDEAEVGKTIGDYVQSTELKAFFKSYLEMVRKFASCCRT